MRYGTYEKEFVEYNGETYYRLPFHHDGKNRDYFKRNKRIPGKTIAIYLHRQIWEDAHGLIPEGYVIHHNDGNTINNDLFNLQCMSNGEHLRMHRLEEAVTKPALVIERTRRLLSVQAISVEKARQPEVRERASKSISAALLARPFREVICHWCACLTPMRGSCQKYACSMTCWHKARKKFKTMRELHPSDDPSLLTPEEAVLMAEFGRRKLKGGVL